MSSRLPPPGPSAAPSPQLRALADAIQRPPGAPQRLQLIQGRVVSVQGHTVTATVGGNATAVAGLPCLGSVPAAGTTVWLLEQAGVVLVLPPVA